MLPAVNGILRALFRPRVIEMGAGAKRYGDVSLLDVTDHFFIERGLQFLGGLHHRPGVCIFLFQERNDFRAGFLAQPCVIVGQPASMDGVDGFLTAGNRW